MAFKTTNMKRLLTLLLFLPTLAFGQLIQTNTGPFVFQSSVVVSNTLSATNVVLATPQWNDLTMNYGYSSSGPSAPSLVAVTNNSVVQQLAFDNNDMLYATAQLPHNIATTNAAFPQWKFAPHVHFTTIGTLDNTHSNVTWRIEWEMATINSLWLNKGTNSVTYGVSNNFQHCVVSLGWITNNPPSGISSVFRCRLMRPASASQDYSNNHDVLLDGIDLHIPIGNTTILGSREEYAQ